MIVHEALSLIRTSGFEGPVRIIRTVDFDRVGNMTEQWAVEVDAMVVGEDGQFCPTRTTGPELVVAAWEMQKMLSERRARMEAENTLASEETERQDKVAAIERLAREAMELHS